MQPPAVAAMDTPPQGGQVAAPGLVIPQLGAGAAASVLPGGQCKFQVEYNMLHVIV